MLDNSSQLLERHQLVDEHSFLVNAPDDLALQYGAARHRYQAFSSASANDVSARIQGRADKVFMYVPKEKPLARMMLDNLAAEMSEQDTLYLVGSNKGGIRSLAGQLGDNWQPATKVASGNHCLLYSTQLNQPGSFNPDDYLSRYQHNEITATNLPGVFSAARLDDGTRFLLENLPQRIHGDVLDFACGSGIIAATLASRYSLNSVTASDISVLATTCAAETLANAPCPYDVVLSDGLAQIKGQFDLIISNPPFHTGQRTNYQIAQQFFATAPRHLRAKGRLLLVANSFLAYEAVLQSHFATVRECANNGRFKVIEATMP